MDKNKIFKSKLAANGPFWCWLKISMPNLELISQIISWKHKAEIKKSVIEQKRPPNIHFQVDESFLHISINYASIFSCILNLEWIGPLISQNQALTHSSDMHLSQFSQTNMAANRPFWCIIKQFIIILNTTSCSLLITDTDI